MRALGQQRLWIGVSVLLAVQCKGEVASRAPQVEPDSVPVNQLEIQDVEMPEPPAPVKGRLVARSFGPWNLDGSWSASAALCETPPMLLIHAGESRGISVLVLLSLPAGDKPRAVEYGIRRGGPGIPDPPAARMGLQVLTEQDLRQFQARDGRIEVTRLDDRLAGTIEVTLEQVGSDTTVKFSGTLDRVPVGAGTARSCAAPGVPDSTGG